MPRGRSSRGSRSAGGRRFWLILGLAVVVIADGVLVTGALAATRPQQHGAPHAIPNFTSSPVAESTQAPAPTASRSPSAMPSPTASVSSDSVLAAPRMLVLVSATEAWRATHGNCSGPDATLEHSTDRGVTWTAANTGQYGIRTIGGLDANAARVRVVGGVGASCAPGASQSFTSGRFWASYPLSPGEPVSVDLASGSLSLPSGVERAPCTRPLAFARSTTGDAVLCSDGVFIRPTASAWSPLHVAGALAITANGPGFTIAAIGTTACHGVSILSTATATAAAGAGASATHQLGCAPVADPTGVTLAQQGNALWLWAGTSLAILPADGGASWAK